MKQIIVKEGESGQRLDKYLGKYLQEAPKSFLYKMMRKKNITLNGKKAQGNEILKAMDEIRLFLAPETIEKFQGEEKKGVYRKLDIPYEDDQVLFVNKPAGILSQKASREDISLVEYITGYLQNKEGAEAEMGGGFRPGVCNRLDRNTSGLVAAGKTVKGLQSLSECFKNRSIHKYYLALVKGAVRKPAHIRGFLKKDEKENQVTIWDREVPGSLYIETRYKPLEISGKGDTLLEVELLTGRSHQIRGHLAAMGHPVIGDRKYGENKCNNRYDREYGVKSQLLHAWKLVFPKEEGVLEGLSERTVTAEPPEIFQKVLRGEGFSEKVYRENKGDAES